MDKLASIPARLEAAWDNQVDAVVDGILSPIKSVANKFLSAAETNTTEALGLAEDTISLANVTSCKTLKGWRQQITQKLEEVQNPVLSESNQVAPASALRDDAPELMSKCEPSGTKPEDTQLTFAF